MNIRGIVKDEFGTPLGGVRIYGTIADDPAFDVSTDDRGDFHFSNERTQFAGKMVRVCAERPGYKSQYREQTLPPGILKLEFKLRREAMAPVVAVIVHAHDNRERLQGARVTGSLGGGVLFQGMTDGEGLFRFKDLDPSLAERTLTLSVEHSDFARREEQVLLSETGATIELELSRKVSKPLVIAGVVRGDGTQRPLAGARVTGTVSGRVLFRCTTDQHGRFRSEHREPDLVGKTLDLIVNAGNYRNTEEVIQLTETGATFEIELQSDFPPSVPIAGKVVARESQQLLAGATVTASVAGQEILRVETDIVGRFSHAADHKLVGQTLTLRVDHIGYERFETSGRLSESGIQDINIGLDQERAPQPLEPPEEKPHAAAISGIVTDSQSGNPLGGARVRGTVAGDLIFEVRTDHDGRFHYEVEGSQHLGQQLRVSAEHSGYKLQEQIRLFDAYGVRFAFELSKEAVPDAPVAPPAIPSESSGRIFQRARRHPIITTLITFTLLLLLIWWPMMGLLLGLGFLLWLVAPERLSKSR
jgi:hypothetical protein